MSGDSKVSAAAGTAAATITAKLDVCYKSTALTILAPPPASLSLSPATVVGGTSAVGTLMLAGPAPGGGMAVTLSTSSPLAITPKA